MPGIGKQNALSFANIFKEFANRVAQKNPHQRAFYALLQMCFGDVKNIELSS
jgi:hypothetical protein